MGKTGKFFQISVEKSMDHYQYMYFELIIRVDMLHGIFWISKENTK